MKAYNRKSRGNGHQNIHKIPISNYVIKRRPAENEKGAIAREQARRRRLIAPNDDRHQAREH